MNKLKNIPVRLRFLMVISIITLFTVFSGFAIIHILNTIANQKNFEKEFDQSFMAIHTIDFQLFNLAVSSDDSLTYSPFNLNDLIKSAELLAVDIENIRKNSIFENNEELRALLNGILVNIQEFIPAIKELKEKNSDVYRSELLNFHSRFITPMIQDRDHAMNLIFNAHIKALEKYSVNLIVVFIICILIIVLFISLNAFIIRRNILNLFSTVKDLEQGKNLSKVDLGDAEEFLAISTSLNKFVESQNNKIRFMKTIVAGQNDESYQPGKEDVMGQEIRILADQLQASHTEEENRKREELNQNWKTKGIAIFSEILRSERNNVKELSFLIIQKLLQYLDIELGTIFLVEQDENGEKYLTTTASYAYDRRKYIDRSFRFGEGLPGTCALEKERIYIDDVPEDYSDIISGVGQAKPRYVLVEPLKIEDDIFGIIELASFRALEKHELDFINEVAESISSTLEAAKTNERNAGLLKQSQDLTEKLLQQEGKLKENLQALEQSKEESSKKEFEITGIINAMNESSLVAEFALNGRYTHMNDKYLDLFETSRDQILGKHHNEFAQVDKYSEEYKDFWLKLKEGNTLSRTEEFILYSGKHLWLQQIFSPIKNREGKVIKILNIAMDLTLAKKQQEDLKKQANEITRQNLEMESLNDAVNTSIIKCELDKDGIITDANQIFESVTGYTRKELLGRNYRLFLKDIEKDQFEKIWSEVLKGKTYDGAIRRTKPTGEEVWLMSTFSPVRDNEGNIYKIYFLSLDITEKRLKYQLLEEANKEIERLKSQ